MKKAFLLGFTTLATVTVLGFTPQIISDNDAQGRQTAALVQPKPLTPLTMPRFLAFVANDEAYYGNRWRYMSVASDLVFMFTPQTCLELGPHKHPLVQHCDTWDRSPYVKHTYTADATITPWTMIRDMQYDVFVALQVMEHLVGAQPQVFREIRRVARTAVISLPVRFNMPDDTWHHNLTVDTIVGWFGGVKPHLRIDVPVSRSATTCSGAVRSIFAFNFDIVPIRTIEACAANL
jgi:hypothetical protein